MDYRLVDYLLNAVDITRESRDYDALSLCGIEQVLKTLAHRALGFGVAGTLRVGALGHQRQYAAVAKLAEARKINYAALYRGVVYLEVAGVHDNSRWGVDSKRACVRNGVVNANELHGHTAHADILARLHNIERSL